MTVCCFFRSITEEDEGFYTCTDITDGNKSSTILLKVKGEEIMDIYRLIVICDGLIDQLINDLMH